MMNNYLSCRNKLLGRDDAPSGDEFLESEEFPESLENENMNKEVTL